MGKGLFKNIVLLKKHSCKYFALAIILSSFFYINDVKAATYYSRASGNWTSNTTWSLTSGGAAVASSVYPSTGDIVIIENFIVTLDADANAASLEVKSGGQLVINNSNSNKITLTGDVIGSGTISGSSSKTITFYLTGGNWNFAGTVSNRVSISFTGTLDQTFSGSASFRSITINKSSGVLIITETPKYSSSITLTAGDIKYSGTTFINNGSNYLTSYPNNLILSGSNTKIFPANTTITGNLYIETGAVANLGTFSHTASGLYLNNILQTAGIWGGSASSATNKNATYFTSTSGITGTISIPVVNSWTGSTNTSWETSSNWSMGSVPISTNDVIIPNVTNKPIINSSAVAKNLTINTNSSLTISGSNTLSISGSFTKNGTFNAGTSGTVVLNGTAQSISGTLTFNNLTLSGSGAKTFALSPTVNGTLSLEGTASVVVSGSGVVTYGTNAALQYNKSSSYTATAEEWITPFVATGGIIIKNSGAITVPGSVQIGNTTNSNNTNVPLNINSGATLTPGGNLITLHGNFINSGTLTSGSGGIAIAGTATSQSIDGFTTTGNLSFTKTSGTATFNGNVNAAALTINSTGGAGTLNLGISKSHTFSGVVTLTAGTLNGGSSILNVSNASPFSITSGVFTASTGTVNYSGSAQTAGVLNYNNLTLSGSGAKTFATTPTVNGILSLEGTASVVVTTGVITYGTNATLQYNKSSSYTATSEEWVTPFVASGGIIIKNTGAVTTPGPVQIGNNTNVPLNINSGATLTPGSNLITLHGNFIKSGTLTSGSGGITISGTAISQSIAGFTTTGPFMMSKTAGTATLTGNLTGASLTINGSGGTLHLGSNLIHSFSGNITLTAGTLNGGTSTVLNVNSSTTTALNGTGSVFVPGTSKVVFGGTNQTLAATSLSFYDVEFSGTSATKTINYAFDAANKVNIVSSAILQLAAGTSSTTKLLQFGGTTQAGGVWGGSGSSASGGFNNSTYFASSTGILSSSTAQRFIITGNASFNAGVAQSLTITAANADGSTITGYTGDHNLIFSGASASSGSYSPTVSDKTGVDKVFGTSTTITFTNGVATVSGSSNGKMKLYKNEGVFIAATDGAIDSKGSDRLSASVSTGLSTGLSFNVQPIGSNINTVFATQPTILWSDTYGNAVTGLANDINIAIGNNPSTATLTGTQTVSINTEDGKAEFTDLQIDNAGTGYTLAASASTGTLTTVYSNPFTISNITPVLTSISPSTVCANSGSFNMTLSGDRFNSQSIVKINGQTRSVTSYTETSIIVSILASDITTSGTPLLTVVNPSPGGGTSASKTLTVTQASINSVVNQPNCFSDGSITVTGANGTSPYTFDWIDLAGTNNGANRNYLANTANYAVIATDANGCKSDTTNISIVAATGCTGITVCKSDTLSDLSVAPDPSNRSYAWTLPTGAVIKSGAGTNAIKVDWRNVAKGSYSVSVVALNDCGTSTSSAMNVNVQEVTAIVSADIACIGKNLNLYATGGSNYTWTGPNSFSSSTQNPVLYNTINAFAGKYIATVVNNAGCAAKDSITISVNTSPTLTIAGTSQPSTTSASGTITITATNTSSPTYAWSAAENPAFTSNTLNLSGLVSDIYTLVTTNANGCSNSIDVTLLDSDGITSTATTTNISCNGNKDGQISLSNPTGGTGSYTISWTGPNGYSSTLQNINGLEAGIYQVTISDGSLNTYISAEIKQPDALKADVTKTNINCYGASTGAITLLVSGGTNTTTYSWTNDAGTYSATSKNISNLSVGVYSVDITDANGCVLTDSYTLTQPASAISAALTITNVSCNSGTNGQIALATSGGNSPYTYSWTKTAGVGTFSSTLRDISNLTAGTYSVTITDNKGCTNISSASVTQPLNAISITTASLTNVNCFNGSNGAININTTGGTVTPTNYTYLWSNGSTLEDLTNLSAGNYTVTVTDANACTASQGFSITQPAALASSKTITAASCNGSSNGSINLTPTGGTSPYSFAWTKVGASSYSSTVEDPNSLASGTYNVTITDANACTATNNAIVTEPAGINVSAALTNINCNGTATGAINLTVTGGNAPYTFAWSGGATTKDVSSLAAGTYTVTVTDNNSCSATASYTISQANALALSMTNTNLSCNAAEDGAISLTVTGGGAPYTYAWTKTGTSSFSATTKNINNLSIGVYNAVVTDVNNCTATLASSAITQPAVLAVAAAIDNNVNCFDGADANISSLATGGTSPYSYSWSNGAITRTQTSLKAGGYAVNAVDANGCKAKDSISVTQPSLPMKLYGVVTDTRACAGTPSGKIELTTENTTGTISYVWTGPTTIGNIKSPTNLAAGNYAVTATSALGCTATLSKVVGTAPTLEVTVKGEAKTCATNPDGAAYAIVTGGVLPYSYLWNTRDTTQSLKGLNTNTYSVTITDGNGCTTTGSTILSSPVCDVPLAVNDNFVTANGNAITNSIATNDIDSIYQISDLEFQLLSIPSATQGTIKASLNGDFVFTPTPDYNGVVELQYLVSNPLGLTSRAQINISVSNITLTDTIENSSCTTGGSIHVKASGGFPGYSYSWSGPNSFSAKTNNVSGLSPGTYTINIKDSKGATISKSYTIADACAPGVSAIYLSGTKVFTYNAKPQAPKTYTTHGSTGAVTISYSGTASTTYTASGTLPTKPGTYKAVATLAADVNNVAATSEEFTFVIEKAPLTITADNQTVNKGDAITSIIKAATYSITGFVDTDDSKVISGAVSYTTNYKDTMAAGTPDIYIIPDVSKLTAENYSFIAANGRVTINDISGNWPLTPNASIKLADHTLLSSDSVKLKFNIVGGTAPYTAIIKHSYNKIIDTVLLNNAIDSVLVSPIDSENVYTLLKITDINGKSRTTGFTKDTAYLTILKPLIVLTLKAEPATKLQDNSFRTKLLMKIKNAGELNLSNVQVNANLSDVFPKDIAYKLDSIKVVKGNLVLNPTYKGDGTAKTPFSIPPNNNGLSYSTIKSNAVLDANFLFNNGVNLAIGDEGEVAYFLSIAPTSTDITLKLQFASSGNGLLKKNDGSVSAQPSISVSQDGAAIDKHPNFTGVGVPVPTYLPLFPVVSIGASLQASTATKVAGGYTFHFAAKIKNFGNMNVDSILMINHFKNTFTSTDTAYIINTPTENGAIVFNTQFDGYKDDTLVKYNALVGVKDSISIEYDVFVKTDKISYTWVNNYFASGHAVTDYSLATDTSTSGINPDPNNDGNPIEKEATRFSISYKLPLPPTVVNGNYIYGSITNPKSIAPLVKAYPVGTIPVWCNIVTAVCDTVAPSLPSQIGRYTYQLKSYDTTSLLYSAAAVTDTVIIRPVAPVVKDSTYVIGVSTNPATILAQVTGLASSTINYYSNKILLNTVPKLGTVSGKTHYTASQTINTIESDTAGFNVIMLEVKDIIQIQKIVDSGILQTNSTFNYPITLIAKNLTAYPMSSVVIVDNLQNSVPFTSDFIVVSNKVTGSLIANTAFNGSTDANVTTSISNLKAASSDTAKFVMNLAPNGYSGTLTNIASVSANTIWGKINLSSIPTSYYVADLQINIPQGFSPNRDGINDKFVIIRPAHLTLELQIFNRWGNIVYENNNYKNEWDGKGTGNFLGQDLVDGGYYYTLRAVDNTGKVQIFKGYVIIER